MPRGADTQARGGRRLLAGALCAFVLCLASPAGSWVPAFAKDGKPDLTSILLVARSELADPYFEDAIVLVLNNLGPGPAGIILNRPTAIPVSQLFPDDKRIAQLHEKVYFGGPVESRAVWFLVRATRPPAHAVRACEGVYLSSDRNLLLQLLHRDKPMEGLRVFIGYAGWSADQLRDEIDDGDWTVKHADPASIFGATPEHPWPAPEHSGPTT